MPDAKTLAAIFAVRNHAQQRNPPAKLLSHCCRLVHRTVVNDQNFRFASGFLNVGSNEFKRRRQAERFVVGRNDDGEKGMTLHKLRQAPSHPRVSPTRAFPKSLRFGPVRNRILPACCRSAATAESLLSA